MGKFMDDVIATHAPSSDRDASASLPLTIEVDAEDRISYALAHNRIPLINGLKLTNTSLNAIDDIVVSISIESILDRPIAKPIEFRIQSIASGDTDIKRDFSLHLDPLSMAQVDESMPAELTVSVRSHDRVTTKVMELDVLSYSQWVYAKGASFNLLPAFVMPNHPAVAEIMRTASDLLLKSTGSSSLEGYQSGSKRATEIAGALFGALSKTDIRYVNPPAQFQDLQPVRTPEQVIDGRLGTCLDLAVTYAACLEQAGISPVLFLVPGHAFAGFLSSENSSLGEPVTYAAGDIDNLVQTGAVVPIETVDITKGASFDQAVANGHRRVAESHSAFAASPPDARAVRIDALIDVRLSRKNEIRPIPARERDDDGRIVVHVFEDADRIAADVSRRTEESKEESGAEPIRNTEKLDADDAPLRIRRWKASLLDLSFRNALLNFTEKRSAFDMLLSPKAIGDLEDQLHLGSSVELRPLTLIPDVDRARNIDSAGELSPDEQDEILDRDRAVYVLTRDRERIIRDPEAYKSRFRSLQRKARRLEEETGSNNLFLVLGTLRWSRTPEKEVNPNRGHIDLRTSQQELRSPVYLLPIRIESTRGGRTYSIRLEEGGFSTPNHCLAEKLRQEFDLDIPDLTEPLLDDTGIDLDAAFQSIRQQLLDQGFNFMVDATAHIAFLDFTTFRLWRDLDLHWRDFMQNSVVRHLVETPNEIYVDPAKNGDQEDADALNLFCPVPFDGSQMQAISAAAAGQSFVLEGPPGTGKSQTIANLLANAIATGKKVLFVAEKQAALSIVKDRLDQVGLGALCLDLHSKGSTTKEIRQQLKRSLELSVNRDEPGWDSARQKRLASAASLRRYPLALHAKNNAGYSAWTGHQYSLAYGDGPAAEVPIRMLELSQGEISEIKLSLEELPGIADAAGPAQNHVWSLSGATDFDQMDRARLAAAIDQLRHDIPVLVQKHELFRLLHAPNSGLMLRDLALVLGVLQRERQTPPRLVREIASREWGWGRDEFVAASEGFVASHAGSFDILSPEILTFGTGAFIEAARQVRLASWLKRRALRKQLVTDLQPYLQDGAALPKDLEALLTPVDVAHQAFTKVEIQLERLSGCDISAWNPLLDEPKLSLANRLEFLEAIRRCVTDDERSITALEDLLQGSSDISDDLADTVERAAGSWERFSEIVRSDDDSIALWMNGRDWLAAVSETLDRWQNDSLEDRFLQLQRWSVFIAQLELLRARGLDGLRSSILSGEIAPEDAGTALLRGLVDVSNQERFVSGALDRFDAAEHERRIQTFGEADQTLRKLMATEIPGRMLDGRPFNSLHQRGEVGELARELTRIRGGASIRELLRRHPKIVLELMPCFLMSPESVARFLDMDGIVFDIVVFDEASQIRVAQAIGSLGRAKSAVIVGDSRQMPPTTFGLAGVSFDGDATNEDELLVPLDLESILSEAVESQVPRRWLSWHYRSQAEELIAFSNSHYYDQRLASFPAPEADRSGYGLEWRRIDGEFESGRGRVNRAEAGAIVDEVVTRVRNDPEVSIGIVTLNIQQMNLIEEMLLDLKVSAIAALLEAPDGLFVKNLESVQGDERDIILFSVAFARNKTSGKFSMNFGALNLEGGERRLNVAVTRARRQVVVFCSFDPEEIDLARTSSLGVRHLRDYLFMVRDGVSSDGQRVSSMGIRNDRHLSDIAEKLRDRGLRVGVDIGLSEFKVDIAVGTVDEPNEWVLAVLLDGPDWAERHTIHDRDCLPTVVLAGLLGWPRVARVWLPSWLTEQEKVLDELERLARMVPVEEEEADASSSVDDWIEPNDTSESMDDPTRDTKDGFDRSDEVRVENLIPMAGIANDHELLRQIEMPAFVPYPDEPLLGSKDELDMLRSSSIARWVRNAMDDAIAQEGPIQVERLTRLVGRRFGLSRVARSRSEQLANLLDVDQIRSHDLGRFVWPIELNPETWREFRHSEDYSYRDIHEIDHHEITNAMEYTVKATYSIEPEELIREAATLFGISRLGGKVRTRLEAVLEWAILENRLLRVNGRIWLPNG